LDSKATSVYVAASARPAAQTSTTRDTEGSVAGEVKCSSRWSADVSLALLDPQVRQSVRKATRDHVVAFFAVDRATPLGTLGIRRARVGWDAEGERRSGLARTGTNCFGHAPEEQQPLDVLKTATGEGAGRGDAVVYTAAMGGPCGRRRVWLWRGSCYNPPCPYSHGGEYTTRGDGVVVVSSGGENERKASQTAPHSSSCSYSFGYGLGIYPLLFSKCHAARCTQHTVCVYWTVSVTSAAVYFIFQWQQEQDMANMANLRS
jgi:hypothetical protein